MKELQGKREVEEKRMVDELAKAARAKRTNKELVEEINKYPGPKVPGRTTKAVLEEILREREEEALENKKTDEKAVAIKMWDKISNYLFGLIFSIAIIFGLYQLFS